jgi:hypothetical protein
VVDPGIRWSFTGDAGLALVLGRELGAVGPLGLDALHDSGTTAGAIPRWEVSEAVIRAVPALGVHLRVGAR